MADLKFTCSHCGQEIECDELWSGHQIQCPTCQKDLTVPPKPDAPPHATLANAKPGQARLSIGASRNERSSAPPPPPPQMATLQQQLNQAKLAKKGNPMKWVIIGAVVIVVGVAGYFGYGYYSEVRAKQAAAAKQAFDEGLRAAKAATAAAVAAAAATNPASIKQLPVIPPTWTLDLDKSVIPKGKANGSISGTNFVPETARLDKVGATYLLRLIQGPPAAPDLEFMLYLRLNAGESLTGHTWTVTQDLKDKTLPQVVKLWKTNPRVAAKQKAFFSGYAMNLELGQIANGKIPGKIFLALPDAEQSVVAGAFVADTSLTDAAGAPVATSAVAPNSSPAPGALPPAGSVPQRGGKKR